MLTIEQLSFGYSPTTLVLDKLSTRVQKGSVVGLLGANGVGKSTFLRLIAGLLYPRSGLIEVLSQNPAKRDCTLLADMYLIPERTWVPDMRTDIYLKLFAPLYPKFDHALFEECASRLELKLHRALNDFSFGQQKKFVIAFGIATRASLLLMDEPTNSLDIPAKEQFRQILLETINEGQTAIISTHQAHDLEGMIDTVMLMDNQTLLTHTLETISEVFSVDKYSEKPENALSANQSFNQWLALTPFNENAHREIDLELLFNAFHQNKQQFKAILDQAKVER